MKKKYVISLITFAVMIGLGSCTSIPKGAVAVKPFDINKYLGKWYEIARMDFRFERDLNNTTADYSLNENGTIKVDQPGLQLCEQGMETGYR